MWFVDQDEWLTAQFEASRPRLRSLAYRMLGSLAEAEDAVQETWLRLGRSDASTVANLSGWLTTVTARVCLDRLRSRRTRPEEPLDGRDPGSTAGAHEDGDPLDHALMAESVGAALIVVLDALAPAERVAFVLHDVFAVPFDEIGEVLGRSPEATRQLASRARRRVQGASPTTALDLVGHREVVDAFLCAARGGDVDALVRLLHPDVVMQPDAAALRMGSLRETQGATAVATVLSGGAKAAQLAIVDGIAGLVWAPGGHTRGVIEFTVVDGKITAIEVTGDAERIRGLDIVTVDR
jgi:RNA polymerase sigma factor (sigma-70 family)